MINNIKFIAAITIACLFFSGCVKDGVDECPPGDVNIHIYVEKFRNKSQNPLDEREDVFGDIIKHMRYYLYKEGSLYKEGLITDFRNTTGNHYAMGFSNLDYADYELVIVGNSTKDALAGDISQSANLFVTYPGCTDTEDYFSAVYPFTVNSDKPMNFDVGLLRMHGVIRYNFKDMPADIIAMEIAMENVTGEKWITGDYKKTLRASRNYDIIKLRSIAEADADDIISSPYIMGTFPTLEGEKAAYHLSLFREGEEKAYRSEIVSSELTITRNQLLDLLVTFNPDGTLGFEILLDNSWDGSSPGGETGID